MFKYDITWIMQSYLGEYEGSRANSDKKFIRAVKSFLAINKIDPRTQLVIASDGCEITHKLYYKHFKKEPSIKYCFVDKDTPKMYDNIEGSTMQYYRGLPRQVARTIAEGFLHAYLDSDDFLMPNASKIIKANWNAMTKQNPDKDFKWGAMTNWIENIAMNKWLENKEGQQTFGPIGEPFKVEGIKSKWQKYSMNEPNKHVQTATWATVHKWDCKTVWKDHQSDPKAGGISEDTIFARGIRKEGDGMLINDGFYLRCHYHGIWDY